MVTSEGIISDIIRREGPVYTNSPGDRGGPTKYGITIPTLTAYRGHPVTATDIEGLTEAEARSVYRSLYVAPFSDIMDTALRALAVDSGVLHGVSRAVRWLQSAVGVGVDGTLGPQTHAAFSGLTSATSDAARKAVLKSRVQYIANIVQSDPSQVKWLEGWLNRAMEFI